MLFFYGGNWQSGRRQDYRFVADTLMTLGCDAVVPDYRLYPHVRFTDILQDARMAAQTVLERLPEDRPLLLMGHSAGAQIGASIGQQSARQRARFMAADTWAGTRRSWCSVWRFRLLAIRLAWWATECT